MTSVSSSPPQFGVPQQGHLNIVHPDVGRRYKLNFSGEVNRLTIGKIKQCLASASSCEIPVDKMVLKLNGVPLSDDRDVCGAIGIVSGSTLSIEHRKHAAPHLLRHVDSHGHDTVLDHMGSFASPRRRILEEQTMREQEVYLKRDMEAQEKLLQNAVSQIGEELLNTRLEKQRLEHTQTLASQYLSEISRNEEAKEREKKRLEEILFEESKRAAARAADLDRRKTKLREEDEAVRMVAQEKLALEERKARLEEEKAQLKAEQLKIDQEQQLFEKMSKEREAQILAQEIELQHVQLSQARQRKELEVKRRIAMEQRIQYYHRMGLSDDQGNSLGPKVEESPMLHSSSQEPKQETPSLLTSPQPRRVASPSQNIFSREPGGLNTAASSSSQTSCRAQAEANLQLLSESLELAVPLRLSPENLSCMVSIGSECSFLIRLDELSERLFIYATLLPRVRKENNSEALELLTFILAGLQPDQQEGATGGITASFHDGSIILSASIHLPTSQPWALKTIAPIFVKSFGEWKRKVDAFLSSSTQRQDSASRSQLPQREYSGRSKHRITTSPSPFVSPTIKIGLEVTDTLIVNGASVPCGEGVIVVSSTGSAAAAGIVQNDWIKKINGNGIASKESFHSIVQQVSQGHSLVKLEVERDGVVQIKRVLV